MCRGIAQRSTASKQNNLHLTFSTREPARDEENVDDNTLNNNDTAKTTVTKNNIFFFSFVRSSVGRVVGKLSFGHDNTTTSPDAICEICSMESIVGEIFGTKILVKRCLVLFTILLSNAETFATTVFHYKKRFPLCQYNIIYFFRSLSLPLVSASLLCRIVRTHTKRDRVLLMPWPQ